jgi:hypothetical protein
MVCDRIDRLVPSIVYTHPDVGLCRVYTASVCCRLSLTLQRPYLWQLDQGGAGNLVHTLCYKSERKGARRDHPPPHPPKLLQTAVQHVTDVLLVMFLMLVDAWGTCTAENTEVPSSNPCMP